MRAALLAAALSAAPAVFACDVDFELSPRWGDKPAFDARLAFRALDRTETRLALGNGWGGVRDFERALGDVRVEGDGISIAAADGGWRITHPPKAAIVVRYRIDGDVAADRGTLDHRDFYRNQLGRGHFHFFGYGAFPLPEAMQAANPAKGCVTFRDLPRDWTLATSFGTGEPGASASRFEAEAGQLRAAVYVGGDFRLQRRTVEGRPLAIALRGDWRFSDDKLADATARVIATHRRFWNDADFPFYLVTLLPNRLASGSIGGTGVTQAFAMHAARDFAVPGAGFDYLIGHEHLHAWMPGRLGGVERGANEALGYWFSEGFTNYLTHRLLVASGVWSLEDYARALNGVFFEAASSTVARASNERIRDDFWNNGAVNRLPYWRGELVALDFARLLERAGTSLEAVLREIAAHPDSRTAPERFAVGAARHVPATRVNLDAYISRGEPLPADTRALGPCFEGRRLSRAPFSLGFDGPASFAARKVTGLVAEGAADRAGVREGMEILEGNVRYGEPDSEVKLTLRKDGAPWQVAFMPRGTPLPVMQYMVRDDARADADCAKWLAAP